MIAREDHAEVALARQRAVYRSDTADALTRILMAPFDEFEQALQDLIELRRRGLRGSGHALDLAGGLVGEPRAGRGDDDYRAALASRIAVLNSSGTAEDLIAATRSIVPRSATSPSRVRATRWPRVAVLEIYKVLPRDWTSALPLDFVDAPAGAGAIPEILDGAYSAGDTVLALQLGGWPDVGRFSISGGSYSGEVFAYSSYGAYVPGAQLSITIAPALPRPLGGAEVLRGPLGLSAGALARIRAAVLPATSAGDDLQVAGGVTGIESAFALASAIALTAAAASGATSLTTTPNTTAQLPASGYVRPAGGAINRYRVVAPGALALDAPLASALALGAIVELVEVDGSSWRPGLGLGVGALYGVAG